MLRWRQIYVKKALTFVLALLVLLTLLHNIYSWKSVSNRPEQPVNVEKEESGKSRTQSQSEFVTEKPSQAENKSFAHIRSNPVPEWLKEDGIPMIFMNENTSRCGGENLGCFLLSSLVRKPVNAKRMTIKQCREVCFQGSRIYAGLMNDGKCYCEDTLQLFITKKGCDAACSADLSQNCTTAKSIRIYRKTSSCQRESNESHLKNSRIACVKLPAEITDGMVHLSMKSKSHQQCVLNCENRNFLLAVPVDDHEACICSALLPLFRTASNMQRRMRDCDEGNNEVQTYPVYRTLVDIRQNESKKFLRKGQGPLTTITSLPGSGNTWIRHLLESATGIYTGSFYNDKKLYDGGLIGELEHFLSRRTIVIKDHLFKYKIDDHYQSAILIIRNLFNATLADYARMQTHNHTSVVDSEIYNTQDFKRFAHSRIKIWTDTPRCIFEKIPNVLVVYFEDIIQDPVTQLKRMVNFLPDDLVVKSGEIFEKRLMYMNLDLTGNFKRPARHLEFDPFEGELRKDIFAGIKKLYSLMEEFDHQQLPLSYFESS